MSSSSSDILLTCSNGLGNYHEWSRAYLENARLSDEQGQVIRYMTEGVLTSLICSPQSSLGSKEQKEGTTFLEFARSIRFNRRVRLPSGQAAATPGGEAKPATGLWVPNVVWWEMLKANEKIM